MKVVEKKIEPRKKKKLKIGDGKSQIFMEFEDQALDAWKKRKKNERVKWGISKKVEGI